MFACVTIGLSYLSHFITLMVMRFRHAGKVCSGDYLEVPNRYSLFDATEPYLHDVGSFLYYAMNSQFVVMLAAMAGIALTIGMNEFN